MLQWLIDTVTDAVLLAIGIPPVFIDRGDPDSFDFLETDLLFDADWHPLNLSTIVPVRAQAVLIRTLLVTNVLGPSLHFRKHGNVNAQNASANWCLVADVFTATDSIVACDTDRIIDYSAPPDRVTAAALTIGGWWL